MKKRKLENGSEVPEINTNPKKPLDKVTNFVLL